MSQLIQSPSRRLPADFMKPTSEESLNAGDVFLRIGYRETEILMAVGGHDGRLWFYTIESEIRKKGDIFRPKIEDHVDYLKIDIVANFHVSVDSIKHSELRGGQCYWGENGIMYLVAQIVDQEFLNEWLRTPDSVVSARPSHLAFSVEAYTGLLGEAGPGTVATAGEWIIRMQCGLNEWMDLG